MSFGAERFKDPTLLAARLLIALLFLIFGWGKFNYGATVQEMTHAGAPLPSLAALVAIVMEAPVAVALILGVLTRPLALLLALYTLGTALIGHHFWTMTGNMRMFNEINFFKNISIIGGLLALYVAGPGRYSLDALWFKPPGA